jgi:hypothetical protein
MGKFLDGSRLAKTAATAATLGFGGSAGQEGPIIQIGASVGSFLSRHLGVPERDWRTLAAAGAAGGLAASFSIPLAGVFFTMEVLLKDFANEAFSAVVICLRDGDGGGSDPGRNVWISAHGLLRGRGADGFCGLRSVRHVLRSARVDVFEGAEKRRTFFLAKLRGVPEWLNHLSAGLGVGAIASYSRNARHRA